MQQIKWEKAKQWKMLDKNKKKLKIRQLTWVYKKINWFLYRSKKKIHHFCKFNLSYNFSNILIEQRHAN